MVFLFVCQCGSQISVLPLKPAEVPSAFSQWSPHAPKCKLSTSDTLKCRVFLAQLPFFDSIPNHLDLPITSPPQTPPFHECAHVVKSHDYTT